jgi:Ankyrin repeats (3 copies)/Ankyrin repeats (many copies)
MTAQLFTSAPGLGIRLAVVAACLSASCMQAQSQSLAMQDPSEWAAFQGAAPNAATAGPLLDAVFDDVKREGPWRVSDQRRLTPDALRFLQLLRASQWDEALKALKQQQPDLSQADDNGHTPLSLAAAAGQLTLVREMIRQGAPLDKVGGHGWTPLAAAVWHGHELVVRDLLRAGARVDAPTLTGQLPLHVASAAGKTRLMAMLVQAGANWRWPNRRGHHAVSEAALFGHVQALQWLSDQGLPLAAADTTQLNAVHAAAMGGHLDTVHWLQQRGVGVPSVLTQVLIEQLQSGGLVASTP